MSYSIDASVGFGLLIPEEKFGDNCYELEHTEGTQLVFAGDACVGSCQAYLCAKNTVQQAEEQGSPFDIDRLVVGPYWKTFFQTFAAKLGIKDPQIGWWLCASGG